MSIIHALHPQTDKLLGYLTNTKRKTFWGDTYSHSLNKEKIFQFTMLANIPEAELFDERGRFIIPSENGGFEEFLIFESDTTMANEKTVYGIATYTDMNKQHIVTPGTYTGTITDLMQPIIEQTEHDLGIIESTGIETVVVEKHEGAYEFAKRVASAFDVELLNRVETSGNRFTGRYMDFLIRIGESNNKEIVLGKDLIGVEKTVNSERVVTALLAIGPDREDGSPLTITVTNEEAFQRWNRNGQHIIEVYTPESNNEDMTIEQLTQYATTELNKRIASIVTYKITAAMIEEKYPHEAVRIGDTVKVKNPDFSPPLYAEARVIKIESSLTDPSSRVYTIGEVITYKENEVLSLLREFQDLYALRVIRSPIPPVGRKNLIWTKTTEDETGNEIEVMHTWNGRNWIKASPVSAEDIGAETPEGAQQKVDEAKEDLQEQIYEIGTSSPNLLLGTRDFTGWDIRNGDPELDSVMTYMGLVPLRINSPNGYLATEYEVQEGTTYTISADVITNKDGMVIEFNSMIEKFASDPLTANEWTRISFTFTAQETDTKVVRFETPETNEDNILWIAGYKLEENDEATDWNNHVEDIPNALEAQAQNVSIVETKLSEIEQTVSEDSILNTVMNSRSFEQSLEGKANAEDLAAYATQESVEDVSNDISNIDERLNAIDFESFALSSDLEQTATDLTARFSASGGINMVRNSVGYSSLDFWNKIGSGQVESIQNNELSRLGFHSGFLMSPSSGISEIYQEIQLLADAWYSLSFYVRKEDTDGKLTVILRNAETSQAITSIVIPSNESTNGYNKYETSFVPGAATIELIISAASNANAIVTALMLNIGDVPFSWTTASGEVYNTNVKMDLNGIRVSQIEEGIETNYTEMTPVKFAGYYDSDNDGYIDTTKESEDEVFRMDKDEFRMKKANIQNEITMGSIKAIKINSGGRKGWAFVSV